MENSPPFDPGQIAKMLILSLLELTLVCLKYHHTKPSIQTYILLKLYDIIFAKDMKFCLNYTVAVVVVEVLILNTIYCIAIT